MSKMGLHDPFGHLKHKLWPKKGRESNWQFDSQPLKVGNHPDFLACRWHATYHSKALDEGYNFVSDLILIERSVHKVMGPKFAGVPTLAILGLPLGSPGTKSHLDVGLMDRHIIYYKGEGWLPPSPGCGESCDFELPMACLSTKSVPTMH